MPDCIDSESLLDYLEGRLENQEHDRVEAHLAACDRCLEEIIVTYRVLHQGYEGGFQAVPASLTQKAVAWIDRHQEHTRWDSLMLELWAFSLTCKRLLHRLGNFFPGTLILVRGNKVRLSDETILLSRSFPGLDAEIEFEKPDSEHANVSVSVSGACVEKSPVRVSLLRMEREVASYLIDRKNAFFESIPFDRYTLVYSQNGVNIGQHDFFIKGAEKGGLNVGTSE